MKGVSEKVRKEEHPKVVVLRQLINHTRVMRRNCKPAIAREAAQLEDQYEREIERLESTAA